MRILQVRQTSLHLFVLRFKIASLLDTLYQGLMQLIAHTGIRCEKLNP